LRDLDLNRQSAKFRNYSQLLKQTEQVCFGPLFNEFSVKKSLNENTRVDDFLSRRWKTERVAQVRALKMIARHHLIIVGDYVVNGVVKVRVSRADFADILFGLLPSAEFDAGWIMSHKVRSKKLVHYMIIALMPDFIPNSPGNRRVTFLRCK